MAVAQEHLALNQLIVVQTTDCPCQNLNSDSCTQMLDPWVACSRPSGVQALPPQLLTVCSIPLVSNQVQFLQLRLWERERRTPTHAEVQFAWWCLDKRARGKPKMRQLQTMIRTSRMLLVLGDWLLRPGSVRSGHTASLEPLPCAPCVPIPCARDKHLRPHSMCKR